MLRPNSFQKGATESAYRIANKQVASSQRLAAARLAKEGPALKGGNWLRAFSESCGLVAEDPQVRDLY